MLPLVGILTVDSGKRYGCHYITVTHEAILMSYADFAATLALGISIGNLLTCLWFWWLSKRC